MLKEKLITFCTSLGLDAVGITAPEYSKEALLYFQKAGAQDYLTGMESFARSMPGLSVLLPEAKSVIVILFPYRSMSDEPSKLAKYAQMEDYHKVAGRYLQKIADFLKEEVPEFSYKTVCDTSPVLEKALAVHAGLGFIGKNHLLIHPKYGSFVVIGALITNLELPFDAPKNACCLSCGRCLESCPGQAFDKDGLLNAKKCASYLTQKKQALSDAEEEIIMRCGYMWGCDQCQEVCPHNSISAPSPLPEFQKPKVIEILEEELNENYKERFRDTVFAYRGSEVMKRNMNLSKRGTETHDE